MRNGRRAVLLSLLLSWRFLLLLCCGSSSSPSAVLAFPCVARHPHSWAARRLEQPPLLWNGRAPAVHHEDDDNNNFDLLDEDNEEEKEPPPQEFFVVDWDGCVADARDWRIRAALVIAQEVWPHLNLDVAPSPWWNAPPSTKASGNNSTTTLHENNHHQWLINKLKALSHVFYNPDPQFSLTCEYALAARLLVEEQTLDDGRSNGRTGKYYPSRYHPQQKPPSSSTSEQQQSSSSIGEGRPSPSPSGSRPLTVGEIAANWGQGGMLRDTLVTRYHVQYHNPLPNLQAALDRYLAKARHWDSRTSSTHSPLLLPDFQHLLQDWHSRRTVIVLVSHPSDLPAALESLAVAHIPCRIVPLLQQHVHAHSVSLLVSTASMLQDLLQACPYGSDVYRVSASWETLQAAIPLMGDDVPQQPPPQPPQRTGWGLGKTPYGRHLCLAYAAWATTAHPTRRDAATMNPWTRVLTLPEWEELVSFQMIREGN